MSAENGVVEEQMVPRETMSKTIESIALVSEARVCSASPSERSF
jgi:hypothetical protein